MLGCLLCTTNGGIMSLYSLFLVLFVLLVHQRCRTFIFCILIGLCGGAKHNHVSCAFVLCIHVGLYGGSRRVQVCFTFLLCLLFSSKVVLGVFLLHACGARCVLLRGSDRKTFLPRL